MAVPFHSCGNQTPSLTERIEVGGASQVPLADARLPSVEAPPAGACGVPIRVLVVDDDESVRAVSVRVLQLAGYKVDTASDGEAGWEALRRDVFHLLITDNCMPRLSGLELIVRLRAAGMEDVQRYSWSAVKNELLAAYTDACRARGAGARP